ncbi:hypothetical protein GCM10027446_10630 [Angustibacter peucedani]
MRRQGWRRSFWAGGAGCLAGGAALVGWAQYVLATGDPDVDGPGMLAFSCYVMAVPLAVLGVVLLLVAAFAGRRRAADPALPPPGWYPDEADPTLTRWWDGTAWTAATSPGEPSSWHPEG